MLNLQDYFPCCSHSNILITSQNHNICQHAMGQQSHCKVSGLTETEAEHLLLDTVGINDNEHADKNKILALTIFKVYPVTLVWEYIVNNYWAGTWLPCMRCSPSWHIHLQVWVWPLWLSQDVSGTSQWTFGRIQEPTTEDQWLQVDSLHDVDNEFWAAESTGSHIFKNLCLSPPQWHFRSNLSECCPQPCELCALSSCNKWRVRFSQCGKRLYELVSGDRGPLGYAEVPLVHAWTLTIIADGTLTCTCTQYILSMSCSLGFDTEDYRFRQTLLPHVDAALQGGTNVVLDVAAKLEHVFHQETCKKLFLTCTSWKRYKSKKVKKQRRFHAKRHGAMSWKSKKGCKRGKSRRSSKVDMQKQPMVSNWFKEHGGWERGKKNSTTIKFGTT